jgi:hypothetical protein
VGRRCTCLQRGQQRVPTAEAGILRDEHLRLVGLQKVLWHPRRSLTESVDAAPDLREQIIECERPCVVLVHALQSRGILRVEREDVVCGELLVSGAVSMDTDVAR